MEIIDLKGANVLVSDLSDGNTVGRYQPIQNSAKNHKEFLRKAQEQLKLPVSLENTFGFAVDFTNLVYELTKEIVEENKENLWGYDVPSDDPVFKGKTSGAVTNVSGVWMGTGYADCSHATLYDPNTNSLANLHLGRDNVQHDLEKIAIKTMSDLYGAKPKDLQVYLGPSIAPEYYLHDRVDRLTNPKWQGNIKQTESGLYTVDVNGAILQGLRDSGVDSKHIIVSEGETFKGNYFSHVAATNAINLLKKKILTSDMSEEEQRQVIEDFQEVYGVPTKQGRTKIYSGITK